MTASSNKRIVTWGLVLSVLFVYSCLFLLTQDIKNINLKGALRIVPSTVTIELILYGLFTKCIWKWKCLHPWLVSVPDLSGEWQGSLHYVWNGQEGDRDFRAFISQSYDNIVITLDTEESHSRSISAFFDIDEKRGIYDLYYNYVNEPGLLIQDRSAIHYGTTRLTFNLSDTSQLRGEYWTSRDSKGTLSLHRVS